MGRIKETAALQKIGWGSPGWSTKSENLCDQRWTPLLKCTMHIVIAPTTTVIRYYHECLQTVVDSVPTSSSLCSSKPHQWVRSFWLRILGFAVGACFLAFYNPNKLQYDPNNYGYITNFWVELQPQVYNIYIYISSELASERPKFDLRKWHRPRKKSSCWTVRLLSHVLVLWRMKIEYERQPGWRSSQKRCGKLKQKKTHPPSSKLLSKAHWSIDASDILGP